MDFETISVHKREGVLNITLDRLSNRNSINCTLLWELNQALDIACEDSVCKAVILEGKNGIFCTGMDFAEVTQNHTKDQEQDRTLSETYMKTLKRFSLIPKVIISNVDGQVIAGGVGIASASDFVIATGRSEFSLSEGLWGLLPAMVTPFLIRRVGFQKAYTLTLSTLPMNAREAFGCGLVDVVSDNPDIEIDRLLQRILKIEEDTILNIKKYYRDMWIINDEMERRAVDETAQRVSSLQVRSNIENYIKYKKFPWEDKPLL
jgi:polyketide biosynthesis enoyl-CoA hydratase PksH